MKKKKNKLKMKSLSLWLVIGVLSFLIAIVGVVQVGKAQMEKSGVVELTELANSLDGDKEAFVAGLVYLSDGLAGMLGASGTRFPHGVSADTTSPLEGELRGTDLTITDDVSFGDEVKQRGASSYLNTSIDIQAMTATTTYAFSPPYGATSTASVKVLTNGLTSSSMYVSCGTSTASGEAWDSATEPDGLIDDYNLVSSTDAIVIDSRDSTLNGTNGRSSAVVKVGEYVKCFFQNEYSGCGSGIDGDTCAQVTSTAAWGGQFPDIIVDWQWRSDS